MPLSVHVSMLNLRFMKLIDRMVKAQVQELQNFYYTKSAELETERFTSLVSSGANQYMQYSVNSYYDQQHLSLIGRVEESLNLIETHLIDNQKLKMKKQEDTQKVQPPGPHKPVCSPASTSKVAIRIMTNWYERNSEHPYPSYETAEVMAKAGGITVEQVKKWFANRRLRLGHTKHITQIAKRRKRSRTVSKDDILLSGCSTAD